MNAMARSVLSAVILLSALFLAPAPIIAQSPGVSPTPAEVKAAANVTYTLTMLNPEGVRSSTAWAVNESGQVVGQAEFGSPGVNYAFFWDGTMQNIHSTGGSSVAWDINDAGMAVGYAYMTDSTYRGWTWTEADGQQVLASGGMPSYMAYGTNSLGQVIGSAIWDGPDGDNSAIPACPGSSGHTLYAINDSGLAVGTVVVDSGDDRFYNIALYDTDTSVWTNLGRYGYTTTAARAVNNSGEVVGYLTSPPVQASDAFLWSEQGGFGNLPTLGGAYAFAYGINNLGQIVGHSKLPGDDRYHAAIWQNGQVADLNDLIPADSGWVLYQAFDINDRGQIVGNAYKVGATGSFYTHAFLLTPEAPSGDVVAPAKVDDLASAIHYSSGGQEQITEAGEVYLLWKAPGDDGDEGTATTYDIRYHTGPITDANWGSALKVTGAPAPAAAGAQQSMIVGPLSTGIRWYFALKTADEAGNWSPLSNIPSVQDSGFRPDPDGYSFANRGSSGSYDLSFTVDSFDRMAREYYDDDSVCKSRNPYCVPYLWAERIVERWNELRKVGNCQGFAITAARFFKGMDQAGDVQPGATTTYGLSFGTAAVWRNIAYYMSVQFLRTVRVPLPYTNTAGQALQEVQQAMTGSVPYPPEVVICNGMKYKLCHVLSPVAIETGYPDGENDYRVRVYDSNHPGTLKKLTVNTGSGQWSYEPLAWQGGAGDRTMRGGTLLRYEPNPDQASAQAFGEAIDFYLTGDGDLLLTDSGGNSTGYSEGSLVNQIAGASMSAVVAGGTVPVSPTFRAPVGNYSLSLNGADLAGAGSADLLAVGPNYATWADDIALSPSSEEQIAMSFAGAGLSAAAVADGPGISLTASTGQQVTLGFALDGASTSHTIEIAGLGVAAGKTGSLSLDPVTATAVVKGGATTGDTYRLSIVYLDAAGTRYAFTCYAVSLEPGQTHYIDYGAWDTASLLDVGVDSDGDGTTDQTMALENQFGMTYVPLLTK